MLGFASGIVFWHFVGFWSFVSEVVFKTDPSTTSMAAAPGREGGTASSDRRKLQTTVYGGIPPADLSSASGCTQLRLDRSTGRTSTAPCDDTPPPVAAAPAARRWSQAPTSPSPHPAPAPTTQPSRKAPSVAGWSTSIQQLSDADPDAQISTSPPSNR